MEVDRIGYNHKHGRGFVIDIPKENGWWLFLLIKTPAMFIIDGKEILTKPNSFILYIHDTPQYYRAVGDSYIDDWFHLLVSDEDVEYLKELKIPFNTVVELPNAKEISNIIQSMAYEFHIRNKFTTEILRSSLDILFLKLSRQINYDKESFFITQSPINDCLLMIRNEIYDQPQRKWSINQIAKDFSMSRSTLQHSYKKIFMTNISSDIIQSRINRAKFYLAYTQMTISEIAVLCGYNSDCLFMKQFKSRIGKSPSEFRNNI